MLQRLINSPTRTKDTQCVFIHHRWYRIVSPTVLTAKDLTTGENLSARQFLYKSLIYND